MAAKNAQITLSADSRPMDRGLKDATKKLRAFGKGLGKGLSGGFGRVGKAGLGAAKGVLGGGGGMLGGLKTAVGLGGLGGIAVIAGNEAAKAFRFEQSITRLRIASMGAIRDTTGLRASIMGISNATGVARENVLAGATAYSTLTGDTRTATESMELFAKISKGTGAEMTDIAAAAAALRQNLKIDPRDFEQAFSILIRGGKLGAVELKDMAGLMAGLAPRMEQFKGGSGVTGLAELGTAFQLTRQGFGDASEAATGLESLMGSIVAHADRLKKGGVEVFNVKNGVKTLKGFREIVEAIGNSKLMRDPTKLMKALGRKEALQTLRMLTKMPGVWQDTAEATLRARDVQEDYQEYSNSTAGKLEALANGFKNTVAQAFTADALSGFLHAVSAALEMAKDLAATMGLIGQKIIDLTTQDDEAQDEYAEEYAERFEKQGKTPEQVEAMVAGGALGAFGLDAAKAMRRRAAERAKKTGDQAWAEGEEFANSALDPDDWTPKGPIEEDVLAATRFSGEPYGPNLPFMRGLNGDPTNPINRHPYGPQQYKTGDPRVVTEVEVTVKPAGWFSSMFSAHVDNAPARRLRP